MNKQECKVRPEIVNVKSDEPVFFPFSIRASKCSGSCNNINDPYADLCVPDVVKNLNIKVFNLMSSTNETRRIEWYEMCKCKCRLWNSSNCECKCDKLCDIGDYLDYENCKCRKNQLINWEEYTEANNEVKLAKINLPENENEHKRSTCTLYIVLFSIIFTIGIGIGTYFVYYKYMNHDKETDCKEKCYILGNNYQMQFIELINGTSQRNKH